MSDDFDLGDLYASLHQQEEARKQNAKRVRQEAEEARRTADETRRTENERRSLDEERRRLEQLEALPPWRRWMATHRSATTAIAVASTVLVLAGGLTIALSVLDRLSEQAAIERQSLLEQQDAELQRQSSLGSPEALVLALEQLPLSCDRYSLSAVNGMTSLTCLMKSAGSLEARSFADPRLVCDQICSTWGLGELASRRLVVGGNWYATSGDWKVGVSAAVVEPDDAAARLAGIVTTTDDYCF
jgi:hypothetical protein